MSGRTEGHSEPDRGVSTSTRSRRHAQHAGATLTPRAQIRRRRLSVRLLPEQPERQEQQAGACIDLTESLDDDDDDEPVLLESKRSSSPVLVQPRKAQQSMPSSASKPKRKRRPQCGICMEDFKSMACGPCGHVYCERCLKEAVKAQKKCPTCRKTLQMKQIHRVYLQD